MTQDGKPTWIRLIRTVDEQCHLKEPITSKQEAVDYVATILRGEPREVMVVLYLDEDLQPLDFHEVSRGNAVMTTADPHGIFREAIHINAHHVIMFHNHPSGPVRASSGDRATTQRIRLAGAVLGIHVIDHLIVGPAEPEKIYSMSEDEGWSKNGKVKAVKKSPEQQELEDEPLKQVAQPEKE